MTHSSKKNKKYMAKNNLVRIPVVVPKDTRNVFDVATKSNETDMSKAIRGFIYKYNSKFINKYGNKDITDGKTL